MNRLATIALGIGAGLALAAGVLLVARTARSSGAEVWTNGGEVRVPAAGAPLREVLWSPAEPLPGAGLGAADEYEPGVSGDGTTLVFVRGRAGVNADLYHSRWSASGWSEPAPIVAINSEADELGPELLRDGTAIYFYSDRAGGLGGYDLWVSRASEAGWGAPINLGPRINSPWNEYGPALTPSGERLYFSSNRPRSGESQTSAESWGATVRERRTRHDYDLYSAEMTGEARADAAPIAALNTPSDEGTPEVSPAGDYLYFASERAGAGGLGGFDLYRARISRSAGVGPAENLGGAVNASSNDLDPALSSDGFRLCFSSDRSMPRGNAGASSADAVDRADRYALWSSVSREVYREAAEQSVAPSTAWSDLWPWLLSALLIIALVVLLIRLLRDPSWRRRFGRLSLVAQCVLLSVLIHAGIASLLTIWKVGTGIIDLIHRDGGGTRVVLGSGAPGGSIVSQIREVVSSGAPTIPELPTIVASVPPMTVDAALIAASLPELVAPAVAPPPILEPARSESRETDLSPTVDPAVAEVSDASAPVPTPSEPARAQPEPAAPTALVSLTGSVSPRAPAPVDAGPAPVAVELPSLQAPRESALSASAVPTTEARGARASIADLAAAGSSAPAQVSTDAALPAIAATTSPVAESTGTGAAVTAIPSLTAPTPVAGDSGRIDMQLQPMSSAREGSAGGAVLATDLGDAPRAARRRPAGAAPSLAVDPIPVGGSSAGLPRASAAQVPSNPEATLPSGAFAEIPVAAAPLGAAVGPASSPGMARIDPAPISGTAASVAASRMDALPVPAAPSGREVGVASVAVPELAGRAEVRIPAEPVEPVETFAQRAPEARNELVEKMGGSAETERAVRRALDWFARHQDADGHWSSAHFDDQCGQCGHPAEFDADAAMTGMALLCYLGAGHTHAQDGPYRDVVDRGIKWLVARQSSDGDLRRGETMYGQTVGAVALCEALAMSRDQSLTEPARRAVEFVLNRATTGQRKSDRDTSVLGWLVFTVESARRAGFDVPRATFDNAKAWLDRITVPGSPGVYAYAPGGQASAAMTAEAMFVRQLLGHMRDESMMKRSARLILETPPRWKEGAPTYYWYYATLALFQHQGEAWQEWNEALVAELLNHQERDGPAAGSWRPQDQWSRMGGRVYQTAVCTLCLEIYYRYRAE